MMKSAIEAAGVAGDPLHLAAVEALRGARVAPGRAHGPFVAAIEAHPALLALLMPEDAVRGEALRYLVRVAAGMRGPTPVGGGDQRSRDDHTSDVPAAPPDSRPESPPGAGQQQAVGARAMDARPGRGRTAPALALAGGHVAAAAGETVLACREGGAAALAGWAAGYADGLAAMARRGASPETLFYVKHAAGRDGADWTAADLALLAAARRAGLADAWTAAALLRSARAVRIKAARLRAAARGKAP